jgi:hypothetical protein
MIGPSQADPVLFCGIWQSICPVPDRGRHLSLWLTDMTGSRKASAPVGEL